jgi:hypothetical protein
MNREQFNASLVHAEPPNGLSAPLAALWWDARRIGLALTHWWMSWRRWTAWLSTPICTAWVARRQTRTIGTNVLGQI